MLESPRDGDRSPEVFDEAFVGVYGRCDNGHNIG